jgi:uncharacterized protein YjbJ (UPF0337 family)
MGSRIDDAKGRMKEAAGDLTADRDMKAEGKADRAGAKVKGFAEDAKDAVDRGVDKVKERMDDRD